MRIVDYRAAVAEAIKTKLPDLQECRPYSGRFDLTELKNVSAQAPAVFVAVLRSGSNDVHDDGRRNVLLNMAAYVLTTDSKDHDRPEPLRDLDAEALEVEQVAEDGHAPDEEPQVPPEGVPEGEGGRVGDPEY